LGFSRKYLCSSVLLYYFFFVPWLFCFLFNCHQEQDLDNVVLSWTPTKWYQSSVGVFAMAEKKTIVGGVKVELKPFHGQINFTLWQWKMKNILIQQDLQCAYWTSSTSPRRWSWALGIRRISRRWTPSSCIFPMKSHIMLWMRRQQKVHGETWEVVHGEDVF